MTNKLIFYGFLFLGGIMLLYSFQVLGMIIGFIGLIGMIWAFTGSGGPASSGESPEDAPPSKDEDEQI